MNNLKVNIINATQHQPTQEQIEAGVYASVNVSEFLTFDEIPSKKEMHLAAQSIASAIWECHVSHCELNLLDTMREPCIAMIGGAPWFMSILEMYLGIHNINPVYAFSERVSEEVHNADGSVTKVNKFKHVGFVGL